jgi:uncharacterized protein YecE (DUF72 family)
MPAGKVFAGTSGWAYGSWRPKFYPAKLGSAKFLEHYATRLNSVEVNFSFGNDLTPKILADWISATPDGFQFAVKANQSITHRKRLRGAARQTAKFLKSLDPLRAAGKLGPVLFQLPPNLKCDLAVLDKFLATVPGDTRTAMEFRHASWFTEDVYDRLGRANVALCEAESEKLVTPEIATADFRYFRLRKGKYSPAARKNIAARATEAARNGDVFLYFKHEDTPEGALYAEKLLETSGQALSQS